MGALEGGRAGPKTAVEGGVGDGGIVAGSRERRIPRSSATRGTMREGSRFGDTVKEDPCVDDGAWRQMQGRRFSFENVEHRHPWEISRETAVQYCSAATRFRSPL